jgi:hypothetical protein
MARRGGDKLFQRQKEQTKKDLARQKDNRNKLSDVIIACEDIASAPTYFQMIVDRLKEERKITPDSFVIADHHHTNPMGVLDDLEKHRCNNGKTYKNFDHKWIVIDRDIERVNGGGHKAEDFNNAVKNAKRLKVNVAYSNDAFELWYLLHFIYRDTAILRDELLKQVIRKLKEKNQYNFAQLDSYNIKNETYAKHIFNELLDLQETAIQNAERLHKSYGTDHNPEKDNPSTTVYLLVKLLNSLYNS